MTLAGVLYVGAGLGLLLCLPWRRDRAGGTPRVLETALKKADLPCSWPPSCAARSRTVPHDARLQRLSAVTGSLLLNLEPPLTILSPSSGSASTSGWRQAGAAGLIVLGEVIVGTSAGGMRTEWVGVVAICARLRGVVDRHQPEPAPVAARPGRPRASRGSAAASLMLLLAGLAGSRCGARPAAWALLSRRGVVRRQHPPVLPRPDARLGAARVAAYFATPPSREPSWRPRSWGSASAAPISRRWRFIGPGSGDAAAGKRTITSTRTRRWNTITPTCTTSTTGTNHGPGDRRRRAARPPAPARP